MINKVSVKVLRQDGQVANLDLSVARMPPYFVEPLLEGGVKYKGPDLFECLCNLRRDLELRGWQLLCAGARTDAYPSSMSRDMSGGKKLYLLQLRERAREKVDLFDEAAADKVGTVDQQRRFYEQWIASLQE